MSSAKPTRKQADLADVLEMVLDKGIVINADIAITVGETEMIGIELRAAIASFETAAEYGLAFPSGTDMRRVEQASGREPLEGDGETIDLGIEASKGGASEDDENAPQNPPRKRPDPRTPTSGDDGLLGDEDEGEAEDTDDGSDAEEDGDENEANAGEGSEES